MMSEHSEKLLVGQVGFLGERSTRTYLFYTPVKGKKKLLYFLFVREGKQSENLTELFDASKVQLFR